MQCVEGSVRLRNLWRTVLSAHTCWPEGGMGEEWSSVRLFKPSSLSRFLREDWRRAAE